MNHLSIVPSGSKREAYLDLLLRADESEEQVRSSMNEGDLYAFTTDGEAVEGTVLAIPINEGTVALKAVAVAPD